MLSDEMTTGSVTTSEADKRAYAVRSHAWNIQNKKFKEAFPDVSCQSIFFTVTVQSDVPVPTASLILFKRAKSWVPHQLFEPFRILAVFL